jgi:hypothetical protein
MKINTKFTKSSLVFDHYLLFILQELGRLREITFREVGEGTGKACDLDLFDQLYLHLFIWNTTEKQIVGAYRLGLSDKILEHYGLRGFYT